MRRMATTKQLKTLDFIELEKDQYEEGIAINKEFHVKNGPYIDFPCTRLLLHNTEIGQTFQLPLYLLNDPDYPTIVLPFVDEVYITNMPDYLGKIGHISVERGTGFSEDIANQYNTAALTTIYIGYKDSNGNYCALIPNNISQIIIDCGGAGDHKNIYNSVPGRMEFKLTGSYKNILAQTSRCDITIADDTKPVEVDEY